MLRKSGFGLVGLLLALGCGSGGQSPTDASGQGGGGTTGRAGAAGFDAEILDALSGDLVLPGTGGFYPGTGGRALSPAGTSGADAGATAGAAGTAGGAGAGGGAGTGGGTGTNVRLFTGPSALISAGAPCTHEEGAAGDRWCAFFAQQPGSSNLALFVLNVTRAAGGTVPTCASGDPGCLRLTDRWYDVSNDPVRSTAFQGDTLIYYDDATLDDATPDDATLIPYAWRPGMTAGQQLVIVTSGGPEVYACTSSLKGAQAICHRERPVPSLQTFVDHDLLAGRVGPNEPPLPLVSTVITSTAADVAAGLSFYSFGFPAPGSGYIGWTARPTEVAQPALRIQQVGNNSSRATVATGIQDWGVNPGGTRWYWFSAVDRRTGVGTLQTAPFPGGASPATLGNVYQYGFPEADALVITTSTDDLVSIADPAGAPTARTTLDSGVLGFVGFGRQGHVAYAKNIADETGLLPLIDLHVKPWMGGAGCTLSAAPSVPFEFVLFTPDGSGVLWIRAPAFDGIYTRLSDCASVVIGLDVWGLDAVGDRALVYLDEHFGMWARRMGPGQTVVGGGPFLVAPTVGSYSTVGNVLVFSVNGPLGDSAADGIYIRAF